jgi:hypothetical protein
MVIKAGIHSSFTKLLIKPTISTDIGLQELRDPDSRLGICRSRNPPVKLIVGYVSRTIRSI